MSLDWCKKQGMKLIEPNDNLAEEYFRSAEETLRMAGITKSSGSNMWLATQKYYAEYLAAYSLLMKLVIFDSKKMSEVLLGVRAIVDTITDGQIQKIRGMI